MTTSTEHLAIHRKPHTNGTEKLTLTVGGLPLGDVVVPAGDDIQHAKNVRDLLHLVCDLAPSA